MDKSHKDPDDVDLNVSRHAQYLHNAWKRHQDAVYWVDINLAIKKGLQFFQTRSNAMILQETLPAYCIPKVVRMKTGEVLYEKVCMSPRLPPKISLKHGWERGLDSEVARQPEGEVARQAKSSQPTQPTPNPIRERSGRPNNMQDGGNTYLFQEINLNSFCEELSSSERTERLVETDVIQTRSSEDRVSMLNRLMTERGDLVLLTIRLIRKTPLEYVLLMKAIRSTLKMKYFIKEWKIHC